MSETHFEDAILHLEFLKGVIQDIPNDNHIASTDFRFIILPF